MMSKEHSGFIKLRSLITPEERLRRCIADQLKLSFSKLQPCKSKTTFSNRLNPMRKKKLRSKKKLIQDQRNWPNLHCKKAVKIEMIETLVITRGDFHYGI